MTGMTDGISRRTLAKGAAWAVPAIVLATPAPAFAASACSPTGNWSGGSVYDLGNTAADRTNQSLDVGGQTYVNNLPASVTVTSITYEFWFQNRINSPTQESPGPGIYWINNPSSSYAGTNMNALAWTPTAGSGFVPTASNTANLSPQVAPDGNTYQAWNLIMTWNPARDANLASRYTPASGGCVNFTTGPSSKFHITYTNVKSFNLPKGSPDDPRETYVSWVNVTINLSSGGPIKLPPIMAK